MTGKNKLYYGDNLFVLREHIPDESVDLVYLDPPFNSNASYNVLFKEHDGAQAAAQIKAFEDTWRWDTNAALAFEETVEKGGRLAEALIAFRKLVGDSDMLAYLSMMAPRLQELRRVLKPTGSIYLHCDPTASHYLKLLMDAVFQASNFKNEVIWKRQSAHSDANRCGSVHDILLFFSTSNAHVWNRTFQSHDPQYVEAYYRYEDENGRRFMSADLSGAGPGPPRVFGKKGEIPPPSGRHWMYDQSGIDRILAENRVYWTRNGIPRLKVYLDESEGMPLQDVWTDIQALRSWHAERLGYPTQKPQALLERILKASSNEGDVVLDPFCGCGTTIDAAQKLGRRWIGIDITHLAINLIRHRLRDTYGDDIVDTYEVIGEPTSVPDARVLAQSDPYQFQWWALGLVGARPVEQKKGADKGIDGRLYFHVGEKHTTKQVIFSVKAGKTSAPHVRDLRGVVEREKAAIGVLISMHPTTKPMRAEAADAGFYESPWGKHPRIQLLTVRELLAGKRIDMPQATGANVTFKKAPKKSGKGVTQLDLTEEQG